MEVAEIKSVMHSLEKAGNAEQLLELLDKLDREIKPSEKLLRETKLGIAVNKFRTHEDQNVAEKVKKVIKKWKDEVSAQKARSKEAKQGSSKSASSGNSTSQNNNGKSSTPDSAKNKFTTNGKPRNAANDGVKTSIYDDSTRNKCIELFYTSLAIGSEAPPADILARAKAVEDAVFEGEKGVTQGYRTKMRSLYSNLKDPNNPNLRANVVSGDISASRLYKMSPQEMASDELKKEMEKMEKDNLFKAQGAVEKRAITNRFTCGKCKKKEVSYYQMQTRSADEPLTTFCTCENCGNRWKFS